MGCWICMPTCGKCRPATVRSGTCLACHGPIYFQVEEHLNGEPALCPTCGKDLTELVAPKPKWCTFVEKTCGNPCGKSEVVSDLGIQECDYWTEPR